jgi:hypothetical protein
MVSAIDAAKEVFSMKTAVAVTAIAVGILIAMAFRSGATLIEPAKIGSV